MLFNSIAFLLFFPIVCVCYFALPSLKVRKAKYTIGKIEENQKS